MGQLQSSVIDIAAQIVGTCPVSRSFSWLENKHTEVNCLHLYGAVEGIFTALEGCHVGLCQKRQGFLRPDCYFPEPFHFLLEVDELQHFTPYKSIALKTYPSDVKLGFDFAEYISLCNRYGTEALKKGQRGYREPKPEFPFEYGRAAQRAYFDAFRDLLAPLHVCRNFQD